MVKLKLNENYSNDFLTTIRGEAFFKDWQKQNRPEWVEIEDSIYNVDKELKSLVMQGTLIMKKEDKESPKIKPEVKKEAINKIEKVEKKIEPKEEKDIKFSDLED